MATPAKTRDSAAHRKPAAPDTPSVILHDCMLWAVHRRIDAVNWRADLAVHLVIWLFSMIVMGIAYMHLLSQINQLKEQNAAILEQSAAILLALGKLGG